MNMVITVYTNADSGSVSVNVAKLTLPLLARQSIPLLVLFCGKQINPDQTYSGIAKYNDILQKDSGKQRRQWKYHLTLHELVVMLASSLTNVSQIKG